MFENVSSKIVNFTILGTLFILESVGEYCWVNNEHCVLHFVGEHCVLHYVGEHCALHSVGEHCVLHSVGEHCV